MFKGLKKRFMVYKFKAISEKDLQVTENNEENLRHPVL